MRFPSVLFAVAFCLLPFALTRPVEAQLETTVRIEAENSGVVTLAPLCNPDVPTVGCWFTETDAKYSGATDTAYLIPGADVATTTVSLDFTGVGIYWIGLTSPNGGLFDFKIDAATNDEVCGRVDTSISAPNVNRCNRILMAKDLTDGPHTLEIKVLGVNALGNDSPDEVYMDAFDVVTVAGDPAPSTSTARASTGSAERFSTAASGTGSSTRGWGGKSADSWTLTSWTPRATASSLPAVSSPTVSPMGRTPSR